MKIHAIQTGTVAVKSRQPEGRGNGTRRILNTFVDREWTDPLPIYAFAIEHPEGVILVDTGETARTAEGGYFPAWHPYFRFGVREWVAPGEEIGPQLERLGIAAADIRWVVLTHFHTDHAGGLHHFPHNEILASRADIAIASGRAGRVRGYPNRRFPTWLDPTPVDLAARPFGPFPQSLPLTKAGDVTLIPLHGHTPGQLGVAVEDGEETVLLAGDASYSEALMLRGAVDGVAPDEGAARETIRRIQALAAERPTVYLVAHDPGTPARLEARQVVVAGPSAQRSAALGS
jgi:glyoxylase-like metal-dependent hydrolase (beta-lactamase superfamily II)